MTLPPLAVVILKPDKAGVAKPPDLPRRKPAILTNRRREIRFHPTLPPGGGSCP